jgi:hypothetical protein
MLTIKSATNPKYTSASGDSITLDVKFLEINETLSFNATATDSLAHGVELYNRAKAGEFGSIATYVAPPQPTTTGTKSA